MNRQVILLKDRVAAVRGGGKGIHIVIHGCFVLRSGSRIMIEVQVRKKEINVQTRCDDAFFRNADFP